MKKNIIYWVLYDFANSLVIMAFLFYFSQWLVIDQGRPSWWYNTALILSSALFIIFAPLISKRIDFDGKKISGLRFWTVLSVVAFSATALITVLTDSLDLLATVLYTFAMYAYLICFLYFTPMLNDLSTRENRASVSGWGQAGNSIGQVTGLLVTLPVATGYITILGESGRAQALLPASLLFLIFSLPIFFLYREEGFVRKSFEERTSFSPFALFKKIFLNKPLAFLLLAYFLSGDALLTFANNFPLYLEKVHGVPDLTKSLLTMAILALAAVGAVFAGKIATKRGELRTLKVVMLAWCLIFSAMVFVTNFNTLIVVFLIAGIFFGPVWSLSRSLVGQLAHEDSIASSYSYYVVAEKFATFIGPAIWSVALITMGEGTRGYQVALSLMAVLMILGFLALRKVKV